MKNTRTLVITATLLLAFVFHVGVARAANIYFPQVAVGGGYSTTFTLMNTGPTALSGSLLVYNQDGSPRAGLPSSFASVSIPAGGSVRLTLPNSGDLTVGSAFFQTAGTVQGLASFDLRGPDGQLQTTAGVLGIASGPRFLIPVDMSASSQTGLAVMNASPVGTSVTMRLISEAGAQVASSPDARLSAFGGYRQIADFINNLFPGQSVSDFRGTVVIEALGQLAATGIVVKEGFLSALPVIGSFVPPANTTPPSPNPPPSDSGSVGVFLSIGIAGTGTASFTLPDGTNANKSGAYFLLLAPGPYQINVQLTGLASMAVVFAGGIGPSFQPTSGGVDPASISSSGPGQAITSNCGIAVTNTAAGTQNYTISFTVTSSNTNACRGATRS
jgi:hypothetical protein